MLACTLLALALRLYTLTRSGYLTGVTEYDDGVYLGGAVRLLHGALPYRDFAFVQPPGILLLTLPVALLTKITTTTHALAAARILTVLASTACVPLAGRLVRHRGTLVTLVTCGILAVYPADIATAHTLILEPWMNLLALTGAVLAFRRGVLAGPWRLLGAGAAIGAATSVKFWAGLPAVVLLAVCLLSAAPDGGRWRRTGRYVLGLAAGFGLPVLPFALAAPTVFVRSTLLDQAARFGTYVPHSMRLANVTGLIDFLNAHGHFTIFAGAHSVYAGGPATPGTGAGLLSYLVVLAGVVLVAAGYWLRSGPPSPLEAFALATAVLATAAITFYSAFFYHYPDFGAPWIAISAGGAFGALSGGRFATWLAARYPGGGAVRIRQALTRTIAVLLVLLAAFQAHETFSQAAPDIYHDQADIPAGACVVTDEISLLISANRFTPVRSGCPDVLDSLGETLVRSNGVSVQGGAANIPEVVAAWKSILDRADYVWLSPANGVHIPWTPQLTGWFHANFTELPARDSVGRVFKRTGA